MIYSAVRNNVLNGVFHYAGAEIEADELPNENWQLVGGQEQTQEQEQPAAPQTLEEMTVPQLKQYAVEHHIEIPARATRPEILELLK